MPRSSVVAWYREADQYFSRMQGASEAIRDPRRIFNCDESGFALNGESGRKVSVLAGCGDKNVYARVFGGKAQVTMHACFSASGEVMAPTLLYPGMRLPPNIRAYGWPQANYISTEKGWMDSEAFVQWLGFFNLWVISLAVQKPVILFIDGYPAHLSWMAADFCKRNGIILYCFLANCSHILQPCDMGLFGPMKPAWRNAVGDWGRNHANTAFCRLHVPAPLKVAWEAVISPALCINAFRKAGIFPFTHKDLPADKFISEIPRGTPPIPAGAPPIPHGAAAIAPGANAYPADVPYEAADVPAPGMAETPTRHALTHNRTAPNANPLNS